MECVFILGKVIYGLKQLDFENERDFFYGKIKLCFYINLFYYNSLFYWLFKVLLCSFVMMVY